MNTKNILPTGIVIASLFLATVPAYAADTQPWHQTLINRIAQKFGLKQSDVQTVFDQVHAERKQAMHQRYEEKLTQLVKDGKITEAQKKLILDKHTELMTKREQNLTAWHNLTPEERRAQMQKEREALETWAKQNNIDVSYLFGMKTGFKHSMGLGNRGKHMW